MLVKDLFSRTETAAQPPVAAASAMKSSCSIFFLISATIIMWACKAVLALPSSSAVSSLNSNFGSWVTSSSSSSDSSGSLLAKSQASSRSSTSCLRA